MLEISRKTLSLEPEEVIELERVITDEDPAGALVFLKRCVYRKLLGSQENRLKSHLDGCRDPVSRFSALNK